MKKAIAAILLLTVTLRPKTAQAWDQKPNLPIAECTDDLPYGIPQVLKENSVLRCTGGYALLHDNDARIAAWAGWTIAPDEALGCVPRDDGFVGDLAVPKISRAEPGDYARSGYDKGHIVPNADLSWSKQTMLESFLMSNMSPQLPNLNRGAWKYLETNERAWAWFRKNSITVYAGNIYKVGVSKTIGANKVVVPEALFKILIDDSSGEVMAFIFPNVAKQEIDLKSRLVSVSQVEAATGIIFPVPTGFDKNVVGPVWPDPGDTTSAKKASCSVKLVK